MIRRFVASVRRTSAVPVLVRVAVFLAGWAALLVAVPAPTRSLAAAVAGLAAPALLAAFRPGGVWVTLVAVAAAGGWVAATVVAGEPVTAGRVLLLAALLYSLHSLATLATTLPHDAAVGPHVWARWLLRTGLVVLASSALSVALLAGLARLPGSGVHLAATLGGLGAAACLAALLSALARRH
jgi:hypothetical protein